MHSPSLSSSVKTPLADSECAGELQRRIDELKKSWPAHSTPPAMLLLLEELEEELEKEQRSKG